MQSFYATRRGFLRGTAIGALGLALDLKTLRPVFADARLPPGAREYTGYRDVYRRKWSWDRIGVGTHSCTNCASGGFFCILFLRPPSSSLNTTLFTCTTNPRHDRSNNHMSR